MRSGTITRAFVLRLGSAAPLGLNNISVLKAVFEKVKGEVLPSASPSVYNQRCLR